MRTFNQDLLRKLAAHDADLCVSLYLEVAVGGGDHKQVEGALKTAKSDAAAAMRGMEIDGDTVKAVQDRLEALDYSDVTGGHDRRVAVFIAPDLTEVVDTRFEEIGVHAGPQFRLAPLVGDLDRTPDHAVLVASQDDARLYKVAGGKMVPQEVEDLPGSLSDVSKFTDEQEKGNVHGREDSGIPGSYKGAQATATGAGPQGVPHHSMGGHDWHEDKEHDLRRYANLLINAAQHHLSGTNMPLVIAADERLYGMIRENSEYPFMAEEGITGHPKEMDEETLRDAAAACLGRDTAQARDAAWDKVAMSLGRDDHEASTDPSDIVTASASGRVAHLFVRDSASLRGRVDGQTFETEIAEDGDEDLVDRAITETLRNRGDVYPLGNRGEDDVILAAAYRYPA